MRSRHAVPGSDVPAARPAVQGDLVPADTTPGTATPDAPGPPGKRKKAVRRTRMGGAWVTLVLGALILVVLLVFILENLHQVNISFFGVHGRLPLGVAMLLAAVAGVLLVVIPGSGRIFQLRRTARRHHRAAQSATQEAADARQAAAQAQAAAPAGEQAPGPAARR
jgi:putative membrane protein